MLDMTKRGEQCWAMDVKNILCNFGFGDVWYNQGVQNESLFLSAFLRRAVDINNQTWRNEIRSMRKIDIYNEIKTTNNFEFYLVHIKSYNVCSLFSKLRCGCLNLQIHTGRINGIPREQRLCTFCNS